MAILTILAFLIEKREMAHYSYMMSKKQMYRFPLTQIKIIGENLHTEVHGATAPCIEIRRHERQYLDAAP